VAGGVERDLNAVQDDALAVFNRGDRGLRAQSGAKDALPGTGSEVFPGTPPCVIPMRVRDDRAIDRLPGVDMKIAGLAIQAAVG
jgi:hypothetical protein